MTGTFAIHHKPAVILFDSGATHSFINSKFGTKVGLDYYPTKGAYMIATPGGKIVSNQICRNVLIQLGSNLVKTDLLLLDLEKMDILLGMDWMTRHRVSLDISSRAVEIDSPYQGTTVLYLSPRKCINSCAYAVEGIKCGRTNLNYTDSSVLILSWKAVRTQPHFKWCNPVVCRVKSR
jgi:hypothetical protein